MRLLFSSILALGLVGALAGCHYTAGSCDCDGDGVYEAASYGIHGSYGMPIEAGAPIPGTPSMKPEAIQKMPKGDNKQSAAPIEVIPGL